MVIIGKKKLFDTNLKSFFSFLKTARISLREKTVIRRKILFHINVSTKNFYPEVIFEL